MWCKIVNDKAEDITYVQSGKLLEIKKSDVSSYNVAETESRKSIVDSVSLLQIAGRPQLLFERIGVGSSYILDWKGLLPYLRMDKQAMKHVHVARVMGGGKVIALLVGATGVAILVAGKAKKEETMQYTGAYIALPALIFLEICQSIYNSQIRRAVRIYNRNAGYPYEDGLERKYRK